MSTIRRAYMEISNGIRGLRLHREQSSQGGGSSLKETLHRATNGSPLNNVRLTRSPKAGFVKRIRTMSGKAAHKTIQDLFMDESFLSKFFFYFSAEERGVLSRVCRRWKHILYNTKYWAEVMPIISYRDWTKDMVVRKQVYDSLHQRGFDAVCLFGATDEDISDFVNNFPPSKKHLRSISVRCANVTDAGLEVLFKKMPCIYRVEISGCNEITETGLWSSLNPKIVSLSISDCINVADDTIGAISQLLPSLYELTIQAYHVTDAALAFFSAKQSYTLCILKLQSCWEITNHGIVNIVHSLPNLTVLSLSGCSKITDDGVELIAENLRKLRVLDISWCPRITDASLEYIACDLGQLEELVLDRCNHVTDIGIGYVSTMTSLQKLYLRWCTQVRDFGLQHLYSMRNLRVLSLAGCSQISTNGLYGLTRLHNLQELELTNCTSATKTVCDFLRDNMFRCAVLD
ncbi:F-box/LRR-repeat protein 16-like [Haliotis rubra]|uniref:F-box/LRR-repeat protein 16-like n=1 Tax=Haliotis rufescens TaxID=6454 RepID=UPI001EAFE6D8|nr:F-box/LRR-repeat protein 16-like [Haliotis rufescens]XP_046560319.1 F-box/LRR-repeat protein 16-like [Haliotis rubra]